MAKKDRVPRGKSKKRKQSKKRKKEKEESILGFVSDGNLLRFAVAWAVLAVCFTVEEIRFGLVESFAFSSSTQADFEKLAFAIRDLQCDTVRQLVTEKANSFDFLDPYSKQAMRPYFPMTVDQFLQKWIEEIYDDHYTERMAIILVLTEHTNIADHDEWCLCNDALRYRLIDAAQLLMGSMSADSIQRCLKKKDAVSNDTIFHQVARSKAASNARFILKLESDKISKQKEEALKLEISEKIRRSSERLRIEINQIMKQSADGIVVQNDIKAMTSQIDIELVVATAISVRMEDDWYWIKNREGFTGFDLWRISHGLHKPMELLPDAYLTSFSVSRNGLRDDVVTADTVEDEHCNFTQNVLFPRCCSPHIISGWNDFEIYWKEQRPVIIKDAMSNLDEVTLQALSQRFGSLNVMVSNIPYGTLFGEKMWSIPLREYIEVVLHGMTSSSLYAFDHLLLAQNPEMRQFMDLKVPFMDEDSLRSGYNKTYQMALGPMNSGSPPHWHQPAFNGLFIGRKMWWVFPPKLAMYSSLSSGNWFHTQYISKAAEGKQSGAHHCFSQEPGDIVFVPREWGHAVSNMEPSLAVAVEYDI